MPLIACRRQADLLDYETQARVIVQLADVRIVMLGVLRKPPSFAINSHARQLLHPQGAEQPNPPLSQPQSPIAGPENARPPSPPNTFTPPSSPPTGLARSAHRISRTRSPSRERRAGTALRLSRTLTHESATSGESSSNRSSGIFGRIRRWTMSSSRAASPERRTSMSILPGAGGDQDVPILPSPVSPPRRPMTLSPTSMPGANATITEATVVEAPRLLPRLGHPEPSTEYAQYPNYTPGGHDNRWCIHDGLEEGGLIWAGPIM